MSTTYKKYTFIDNPLLIIGYGYVIFTIILDFKWYKWKFQ